MKQELSTKYELLKKDYNDFVYIVSHDFKAAFRKINSLSGWLLEDLEDNNIEEFTSHIDMLQKTAKKMDQMLEGLTLLSRVDRIDAPSVKINFQTLVQEIMHQSENNLNDLSVELTSDNFLIEAPDEKIRKIITNLLKNAFEYNENANKNVVISTKEEDDYFKILFKDNGIGISLKHPEEVFRLFMTEKHHHKKETSGYGLTYAKKLAESENADIVLIETSELGSTFAVCWPKEKIFTL